MSMTLKLIFFLVSLFLLMLVGSKVTSNNITVIGSVFCDSCPDNTFSNRSYFLQGAKVRIKCRFKANSAPSKDMRIAANKITDKHGVYKLDIPPIKGFKCQQGRAKKPPCHAILIESPSSLCNHTGFQIPTTQIAIRLRKANLCILNLNALNYRPPKRDVGYCGAHSNRPLSTGTLDSSLFFWPLLPPFLLAWRHWSPLPSAFPPLPFPFNLIPLPDPSSLLPFSLPPSSVSEPIVSFFPIFTASSSFLCTSTGPTKLAMIATSYDLM